MMICIVAYSSLVMDIDPSRISLRLWCYLAVRFYIVYVKTVSICTFVKILYYIFILTVYYFSSKKETKPTQVLVNRVRFT